MYSCNALLRLAVFYYFKIIRREISLGPKGIQEGTI